MTTAAHDAPLDEKDPGYVRRVVTATDPSGRAVILSDGPAPVPIRQDSGYRMVQLWRTHTTPPDLGGEDLSTLPYQLEPPAGGAHFRIVVWPPTAGRGLVHSTDTLDVLYIVSGAITLGVGDAESGTDVALQAGDCVVALGNVHSWHNVGPEPCVAVASMVSALPVQ